MGVFSVIVSWNPTIVWLGPARHPPNIHPELGMACSTMPVPDACQELMSDEMGVPFTRMIPGDAAQETGSMQEKYWMPNLYKVVKAARYCWMLGSAVTVRVLSVDPPDSPVPVHDQPAKVYCIERPAL